MAITKYLITIKSELTHVVITASYQNGEILRFERKILKKITEKQWTYLFRIIPMSESEIPAYQKEFKSRNITYSKIQKEAPKSLFKRFMDEYHQFYIETAGIKPKIDGSSGKSLKAIIKHFEEVSDDTSDDAVFALWQAVLTNWHKLEPFYSNQMELRQINSNINIIMRQLKDGKPTDQAQKAANNNADAIRESL